MNQSEGSIPETSQFRNIRSRMQGEAALVPCYRPCPPECFALCGARADVSQYRRSRRCTRDEKTGGQCTPFSAISEVNCCYLVWRNKQVDAMLHVPERIPFFIAKRNEPVEVAVRASARQFELPLCCAMSGGIRVRTAFSQADPGSVFRSRVPPPPSLERKAASATNCATSRAPG